MIKRSILMIFMTHEEPVTGMAVASLLPQLSASDTLLILHNGVDGKSYRAKYEGLPRVEYHESDRNLGVAGGRNYLLRQASCQASDLVFLVDSDAVIPTDYLDRMTAFLEETPDAGIVGPVVLDYPRMKEELATLDIMQPSDLCGEYPSLDTRQIETLLGGQLEAHKLDHIGTNPAWRDAYIKDRYSIDQILKAERGRVREDFHVGLKEDTRSRAALRKIPGTRPSTIEVTNIAGCGQSFRRELLDEIGELYDLYSPYGLEDVDFAVRALKSGKRNLTTNASYMLHKTDDRHGQRTTPAGHFRKRMNDSRTRTIFEYRWEPDDFPRNSLQRVMRRSLRHVTQVGGHFKPTREGLIAEMFGMRKALNQLAHAEGEAFGKALTDSVARDPALKTIYQLLDAEAVEAAGLSGNKTVAAAQSAARGKLLPVEGGPRRTRFDAPEINAIKRHSRGPERFGNTYPPSRQDEVSEEQREKLAAFKDLHKGERCFIVGNGPSLKKTDFNLLRDEATFAVNGIFYMFDEVGFAPTYYVVEDNHVVDDNLERIIAYPAATKFFPAKFRSAVGGLSGGHLLPTNWEFYYKSSPWFERPRFSRDITETIYVGQTVTYLNLQLAYYMGFSEVVLVGVDFSYQVPKSSGVDGFTIISNEDDPNHFHPAYFGKGKKWHFPKLENCKKVYQHSREIYEEDGREVIDATIGGKLEVYRKTDFYGLFEAPVELEAPNTAATYFVRRILLEALGSGANPALSLGTLPDDAIGNDIKTIAAWYKRQSPAGAAEKAAKTPFDKVIVSTEQPPGKAGSRSLLVLVDAELVQADETGRATPSPVLTSLMKRYEYVVVHNGFALASNAGMPDFLKTDFGLGMETRNARRPNLMACLAEANEQNMSRRLVGCDIFTVGENVFGLPEGKAAPDTLDFSLVAALLDTTTPVLLRDQRLYFPR